MEHNQKIPLKDFNQAQAEEISQYRNQHKHLSRFESAKKWISLYAVAFRASWQNKINQEKGKKA